MALINVLGPTDKLSKRNKKILTECIKDINMVDIQLRDLNPKISNLEKDLSDGKNTTKEEGYLELEDFKKKKNNLVNAKRDIMKKMSDYGLVSIINTDNILTITPLNNDGECNAFSHSKITFVNGSEFICNSIIGNPFYGDTLQVLSISKL